MIDKVLKHYLSAAELKVRFELIDSVELSPDCVLSLISNGTKQYVIATADYLILDEIIEGARDEFSVKVMGWCRRQEVRSKGLLVRPEVFKSLSVNETDEEWEAYHDIVCEEQGWKQVLLLVEPASGQSPKG